MVLRNILFWILLFISPAIFGIKSDRGLKNITDSLRNEILKYTNDSARFKILCNYFWIYANSDLEGVKSVGEWAFNEIKNSKNLRALSDGYDIKGFIYRDEENYDSAFFYFGRALGSAKKVGYKTRIAWSYYHLGELNYLFGDFKSALDYMKYSVRYFTI
ncbi:MAG TPA: tetratricopeptide repeat protein [Bacteroidales bacterium]